MWSSTGSVIWSVLLNFFINYLDDRTDGPLIRFVGDTILGSQANIQDDRTKLQFNLDRLKDWVDRNNMFLLNVRQGEKNMTHIQNGEVMAWKHDI